MDVKFTANQVVELAVTEQPVPIQHYLRQPQRLILALADPSRIDQLSKDCFRLKMRPLNFMMLHIQPIVDMQLWAESNGTIHLRSVACELKGIETINQHFELNLAGMLHPERLRGTTYLKGRADLQVKLILPPSFWMTPKPLIEATGNGLLRSVLMTIKQRLMHQLLADYRRWAIAQTQPVKGDRTPVLAGQNPLPQAE
jgi:hypothetical protein